MGQIVEEARTIDLLNEPLHPYTQGLLASAPTLKARRSRASVRSPLTGDPPNPADAPKGCHFHPRCPMVQDVCRTVPPALRSLGNGRRVACHLAPHDTVAVGMAVGRARRGLPAL